MSILSMLNKVFVNYFFLFVIVLIVLYLFYNGMFAGDFDLKCIISDVDGNKYCVRERERLKEASNLLATITKKCRKLVDHLITKYPDKELCILLHKNFNPNKIMETLPTSTLTAYSENKGEKIAFCLNRKKEDNNNLIDENTLTFVALHELAHLSTESIGHKDIFWSNFKFILQAAKDYGIYNPVDYKNNPTEYCSMTLNDNPLYDYQ